MPDALEIIEKVLSQHYKITENVKTTGERMNDVDAIFNVQVAAYKTAQSAFSVPELLKKRDELLKTVEILGEGLRNHFTYEEKVFPLLFGEILLKAVLHDHSEIQGSIEKARTILANLQKMSHEELLTKRLELIESVNALRSTVDSHAHYEENVLNAMRAVFEVKRESTGA
jgi:hypothetical protein